MTTVSTQRFGLPFVKAGGRMQHMRLTEALDLYIGDLARRGKAKTTRATYFRLLGDMVEACGRHREVNSLELADYENFINRWVDAAPSTLATGVSIAKGFSKFLHDRGETETDVARSLKRPRRIPYEDLQVTLVSRDDVVRMIQACETEQELVCIATACYLGSRRKALAQARRRDMNLDAGTIDFHEKGRKFIRKRIPNELLELYRQLDERHFWAGPDDYLIPNRRPASVKGKERSDKVIWMTVKKVAARAGIECHVHALRAAFACQFDDQHPGDQDALQEWMGHQRFETTAVYLRRKKRQQTMETGMNLSFGFSSQAVKAHTGFEPVPSVNGLGQTDWAETRRQWDAASNLLTAQLSQAVATLALTRRNGRR